MTIRTSLFSLFLLFSLTLSANEREFTLEGNEIFIGPLEQEAQAPAYERIKVFRTKYTDDVVKILYFYDIEETWCEDRNGGYYGGYGRYYGPYYNNRRRERNEDKTSRGIRGTTRVSSGRGGSRVSSGRGGHGGHGYGYGHGAPIPSGPHLGTCRRWEDRPATRNKVLTLDFSNLPPNEDDKSECFYISFLQKAAHNVSVRTNVNQCRNAERYIIKRRGNTFYFFQGHPRY